MLWGTSTRAIWPYMTRGTMVEVDHACDPRKQLTTHGSMTLYFWQSQGGASRVAPLVGGPQAQAATNKKVPRALLPPRERQRVHGTHPHGSYTYLTQQATRLCQ